MDATEHNWSEYRRLVLDTLERIDKELALMNNKIDQQDNTKSDQISDMKIEIGMLKVKAAMGGVVGGAIASGVVSLIVGLLLSRGR